MLARKLGVTPEYLETGAELDASQLRELRLAEQELALRLEGSGETSVVRELLEEAELQADLPGATRARIVLGLEASRRGDHLETVAQLSRVVDSELVTAAGRPDVYSTLGRAHAAAGSTREAVALFERALGISARTSRGASSPSTICRVAPGRSACSSASSRSSRTTLRLARSLEPQRQLLLGQSQLSAAASVEKLGAGLEVLGCDPQLAGEHPQRLHRRCARAGLDP